MDALRRTMEGKGCVLGEVSRNGLLQSIGLRAVGDKGVTLIVTPEMTFAVSWRHGQWAEVIEYSGEEIDPTNDRQVKRLQEVALQLFLPPLLRGPNARMLLTAIVKKRSAATLIKKSTGCSELLVAALLGALSNHGIVRPKPQQNCA